MINVTKRDGKKFRTAATAIMAMQAAQMYFSLAGYSTSASINLEVERIELTVYFDGKPYPKMPNGYMHTKKEIRSHEYYSPTTGKAERIRAIDYMYEYEL